MTSSPTPGLLLHLFTQPPSSPPPFLTTTTITRTTHLTSAPASPADTNPPLGTLYELTDITPLLAPSALTSADSTGDWLLYKTIPGGKEHPDESVRKAVVPAGAVVIAVGITPRADGVDDLHAWYRDEHIRLLSRVPGWRRSVRGELVRGVGSARAETPFIAIHFWDEANGVGGEAFMECIGTPWTVRIREGAARPHYRGQWRVEGQVVGV